MRFKLFEMPRTFAASIALFGALGLCIFAVGCSDVRPSDGEEQIAALEAFPDVKRYQGFVTPPQTNVQLWYERLGEGGRGSVVFLNGNDTSAVLWSDDFITPFVAAGYQVVRYDPRDNGRSEWIPWPEDFDYEHWTPDKAPIYPMNVHVQDLLGLLDALSIHRAHLVGLSMGGMVAQLAALEYPERVASLVLLSTSPSNSFDEVLGAADPAFFAKLAAGARKMGVWSTFQWVTVRPLAAAMADTFLLFVEQPSDRERREVRTLVDRLLEHAPHNPRSAQGFAIAAAKSWVDRLSTIVQPTLVIHGDKDQMFPFTHGEAIADNIPNSRLISIAGLGHGVPISHFKRFRHDMLETFKQAAPNNVR